MSRAERIFWCFCLVAWAFLVVSIVEAYGADFDCATVPNQCRLLDTGTGTDVANFFVNRDATAINGGTPGFVNSAARFSITVGPNDASYEWALTATMDSNATAGQNVAGYFQAFARSTGEVWGIAIDVQDRSPTGTATVLVGDETKVTGGKTVIGHDVILAGNPTLGVGQRIGPADNELTTSQLQIGTQYRGSYAQAVIVIPANQAFVRTDDMTIYEYLGGGIHTVVYPDNRRWYFFSKGATNCDGKGNCKSVVLQ